MDKQLIERCAIAAMRETAEGVEAGEVMDREIELAAIDHMDEESKSLTVKLFSAFLARIDAERWRSPDAQELIRTAPARIWLQVSDEPDDIDAPFQTQITDEITWSTGRCVACEVEYVRADLSAPTIPEGMAQDAERYRFIRMNRLWLKANLPLIAAPAFDEAIDAGLLAAAQGERNAD